MGLLETGAATLINGEQRISVAAQNAVNTETPGYKKQIAYSEIKASTQVSENSPPRPSVSTADLGTQGTLFESNGPLDLAIAGDAHFLVRQGDDFFLTRGGQFSVGPNGTVIDPQGRILQQSAGADLEINSDNVQILPNGTVLDREIPIAAIGLFSSAQFSPSTALTAEQIGGLEQTSVSEVRQGMLERSNVTLSDEMVEMMRAQRQVESGAQLVRAYDQLMDRAISTFSRSGS